MTQARTRQQTTKPAPVVEPPGQPAELILAFDNAGQLIMFQPLPAVVLRRMAQALIQKADSAMVPASNGHQPANGVLNEIETS